YIAIAKPDDNPRWPAESTRVSEGSPLGVQVPSEPGEYNVLYVLKHGYKAVAEQPITVTAAEAEVSAPEQAIAGPTIRVECTGPTHYRAYIAIAKPDDNPRWPAESTRVSEGSPLGVQVP